MKLDQSPEWHERRRKAIGGSDAAIIMTGDAQALEALRQEKLGRLTRPAILSPWEYALRHHTESLQLDWYEHTQAQGRVVIRGEYRRHLALTFMACELDGRDPAGVTVNAKHLSEWIKDPLDWARQKYAWQVCHEMTVANVERGCLSIIVGTKEPQYLWFERDPFAEADLIGRCHWFWGYVERDEPIPGGPVLAPADPPAPVPDRVWRKVDLTGNNAWAVQAGTWIESQSAAKRFEQAARDLKAMVEGDVSEATGHGITIKRSKAGALSIKESKL